MEHPGAKAGDFWLAIGDGASTKRISFFLLAKTFIF
jgi:hypothetical protein